LVELAATLPLFLEPAMRVLVADDDVPAADSLAILARHWGYEAITVYDGKTALAKLRAPDAAPLAVLDWFMPGMNGVDVCREIRKDTDRPYIYIVLVTGRGGREDMLNGLQAGADEYLTKPVDPNELCARLCAAKRILALQEQLLQTQQLLRRQATQDALTGLWNRATILEVLDRELARGRRENQPVTILMADLDHFKTINDTLGHLAGDEVLRQAGQRLRAELRPYDMVGRYGGEEFLIVLPGCTAEAAIVLAERLRRAVETAPIRDQGKPVAVTMSLGIAAWDGTAPASALLRAADAALYRAKSSGRNRAVRGEISGVASP
jgi:two-component system cell cycle response regulator